MRRFLVTLLVVLLAGCSGDETTQPEEDPEPLGQSETDDPDTPEPPSNQTLTSAPVVWHEILVKENKEVFASVATGVEGAEWFMSFPIDVTIPDDPSFQGVHLEIYWGAETGGVAGGVAGLWAEDIPETGVINAKTLAVAEAAGLETGATWLSADKILEAENPTFRVAAADGPNHALYGTATVAITAFFGGQPASDYTALDG